MISTIDFYMLAITQAFSRWHQKRFHRDNFWLSSRFLFIACVAIGLISIFINRSALHNEYPEFFQNTLMGVVMFVIVFIGIVEIIVSTLWEPNVRVLSQQLAKALESGEHNPMIMGRRGLRFFAWICTLSSIVIPISQGNDINYGLTSVAIAFLISIYLACVQPLSTKE